MGDLIARDGNGARGRHVEAAEQIEQRGLSRAARAHESHEVALVDVEIQALQDVNLFATAAVGLIQSAHADEALRSRASIDSNHAASPLLADFDLFTVTQILWTLDYDGIARRQARQYADVRASFHSEADRATLCRAVLD